MTRPRPIPLARCWTLRLTALALIGTGSWAAAQDELAPNAGAVQQEAPDVAPSEAEQAFDRTLFRGDPSRVGVELPSLTRDVEERVDRLAQEHGLSDGQKKKLLLAAKGDLKHFSDEVDEARLRLRVVANRAEGMREAEKLRPVLNLLVAGEGPLLIKVFKATLPPERRVAYETAQRQKRMARHKHMIGITCVVMVRGLGLTDEQRTRFAKVLVDEIPPPRDYGTRPSISVLCLAARIPEQQLQPLFDELQWTLLRQQLTLYKRYERNLPSLGFIPGDDSPSPSIP